MRLTATASGIAIALALSACTITPEREDAPLNTMTTTPAQTAETVDQPATDKYAKRLKEIEARVNDIEAREAALNRGDSPEFQAEIDRANQELADLREQLSEQSEMAQVAVVQAEGDAATSGSLPPDVKPGECYTYIWVEPEYKTVSDRVMVKEAGEKIEIIPAVYRTVAKQISVKGEVEKLQVVPATYKWVEEKVEVQPARSEVKEIPAVYESITDRVIDEPARTIWKKGTGPIQKVNEETGEIMCLVEVPATYKMITKRVVKTPAHTETKEIPAVYKVIKSKVVDVPAHTKTAVIPAQYKTVEVRELVSPASEKRIPIPAEYSDVSHKELVHEGKMEWRSILCKTNMTTARVKAIQQALVDRDYAPGPIDGMVGHKTMGAINKFERDNNLPVDKYLNLSTIRALGVTTH